MIILVKGDYVDFKAPPYMSDEQKEKFIDFFKEMFPGEVDVVDRKEKTKSFGKRDAKPKKWQIEEFALLLGPESNIELAAKMDRREMSVVMQRGDFVSKFLTWLKKKGYSARVSKEKIQEYIHQYLNDKEGR